MAQLVVGAGGGPYSATVAANATQYRHANRSFPKDSIAVVWFSHWGTYQDYRNGEFRYENWGHVVIWDPTAFNGHGGFFSSRRNGFGGGEWFRTIQDVEWSFNSTYLFWSEDLNGVRVCAPAKHAETPKPKTNTLEKEQMIIYYPHAYGKGKPGWLILGFTKNTLILSSQKSANDWAARLGFNAITASYDGFLKYLEADGATKAQIKRVAK